MANELYRYTNPDNATYTLTFDSGIVVEGVPVVHDGRADCKMLAVPLDASGGAVITQSAPGYQTFSARARFMPNPNGPASLDVDDITLAPLPVAPPDPEPQPPTGPPNDMTSPLDRINWWYATGRFNLVSKEGCGQFVEAVCDDFHVFYGPTWGHVKKTSAQNQYRCHAVDALQNIAGSNDGIWDIIYSSASTSAKPVFNRAGDANPDLYCYPTEKCCQQQGKK